MAVIGELATLVTARTAPFERGMKRSRESLTKFQQATKATNAVLLRFGAPLAAAAAGLVSFGATVGSVRKNLDQLDRLAKLSSRIGETAANITRLQFAADQTGVSADQMAMALDVMVKRLGEAAEGSGEAAKTLQRLGISADAIIRQSPAEAFALIADRISKLNTQSEKAAAVSDIFSRANLNLVNTLDLGRAGLASMANESDRLGNTVNSNLSIIERTNDSVSRMKMAFGALGREITLRVAPPLAGLAEALTDVVRGIRGVNKEQQKAFPGGGGISAGGRLSLTNLGQSTPFAGFTPAEIAANAPTNLRLAERLGEGTKGFGGAIESATRGLFSLGKAVDKMKVSAEKQIALIERGKGVTAALRTPLERFEDRLEELTELRKAGVISRETFGRGIADARRQALETVAGRAGGGARFAGAATKGSSAALQILAQAGMKSETADDRKIKLLASMNDALLELRNRSEGKEAEIVESLIGGGF